LRSPRGAWLWLVRKEWRELMTSRSWWIMLALTGPLVGMSFISAVATFAEVSSGAGSGCSAVCDPLTGIWAPTFSAYELVAVFLLPFVAIRLVSGDRQSGALKLELQQPMPALNRMAAKAVVLLGGWLLASAAAVLAIGLWRSYGGAIHAPEIGIVAAGHVLNAGLTIALAVAAASIAEHPSTAAILTLGFTVGTWIIDFVAAIHGGFWERVAAITPTAMVGVFQHGLVEANVVIAALAVIAAGLGAGAVWLRLGVSVRRRAAESLAIAAAAAVIVFSATFIRASWDGSEGRVNSFSEPEQEALERITGPLRIEVHLAPVDPRRTELDRAALAKLFRVMKNVTVSYTARTSSGLYESADPGYGEIWYDLGGKREMSRMVTSEGVLETIFSLAGVSPNNEHEVEFAGHPLTARATGAAVVFYGVWPGAVGLAGFLMLRGRTT
jgi:hypothetical protein